MTMTKHCIIFYFLRLIVLNCGVTGVKPFPIEIAEKAFEISTLFKRLLLSYEPSQFKINENAANREYKQMRLKDIIAIDDMIQKARDNEESVPNYLLEEDYEDDQYYDTQYGIDETLDYISDYGNQIALLLSLPRNRRTWWLWQHSIFANTVPALLQMDRVSKNDMNLASGDIDEKLTSVQAAITTIMAPLGQYIREKNPKYAPKNYDNVPIEEVLQKLPTELDKFNVLISKKFRSTKSDEVQGDINSYKPINLFLHYKGRKSKTIDMFKSKSKWFEWPISNDVFILQYRLALVYWVNNSYAKLKAYYHSILFILKTSVYGHLKRHIILSKNHLKNLDVKNSERQPKKNHSKLKTQWEKTQTPMMKFIEKFDLSKDEIIKKILSLFKNKYFELSAILELLNDELTFMMPKINVTEVKEEYGEEDIKESGCRSYEYYLEKIIQNNNELENYINDIIALFADTNFNTINIFYDCIPKDTENNLNNV